MSDQHRENPFGNELNESINLIKEINVILAEDEQSNPQKRWKTRIAYIMSTVGRAVAQFSVTRIMNDELSQFQSYVHQIFRRSNYADKIKKDTELQNIFLLGYFHAVDDLCIHTKGIEDSDRNGTLSSIVKSHKHTTPILLALNEHIELSHEELANVIGISKTALSNYMSKVRPYFLFNSVRIGKHRYYTIAKPCGANALEIAKRSGQPSIETFTTLLLMLLESLNDVAQRDECDENYVAERCDSLITKYTTSPAVCKKLIRTLARNIITERISAKRLALIERVIVKNCVSIFTTVLEEEVLFIDVIISNLKAGIKYHWFVVKSKEFSCEKSVINYLLCLFAKKEEALDNDALTKFMKVSILSPEDERKYFGNTKDVVIYDNETAYHCTDDTIETGTPFHAMSPRMMQPFIELEELIAV